MEVPSIMNNPLMGGVETFSIRFKTIRTNIKIEANFALVALPA